MPSKATSGRGELEAAEAAKRHGITLENCEDEPIRIPGSIQRHGFLLLLDPRDRVVGASENAGEFLEVPFGLVLGAPVATILQRELLAALRGVEISEKGGGQPTYLGAFHTRGKLFSVVAHRVGGDTIVEFERMDRLVSPELTNETISNFVSKLSTVRTERDLCQALTKQLKELTEFNRVLMYRFDEAGHGTVLSEENDGTLPSYLDLRFPASDIPRQARELYVLNTVRIIPDANYVPSPLLGIGGRPMASLDLSMSTLRSVSPLHLEYMRNMGTLSSMSVSIVCEGRLWGLIGAHHAEPRTVPYLVRSACDLLAKLCSTQLMSFRMAAGLTQRVHFHAVQRRILTAMAAENNYVAALAGQMEEIVKITDADGAALVMDGQCRVSGLTPSEADLMRLAEWIGATPDLEVLETRHLAGQIEWAEAFRAVASGLLVIRISSVRQSYLMWFRQEELQTVLWAGDPEKPQERDGSLNPRTSFETWKELLRGRGKPWTEMEIESATEFRGAVTTISLKRAEEALQLGEARFLQLTHALPHPVWTADDQGELTYVNHRWKDEGLGQRGRWYEQDGMVAEDRARCGEAWKTAVERGTPFDLEVRLRVGGAGPERWNLLRVSPYLRADGGRGGWVGTCTDLTDRRRQESALRMAEKLALTGRMTSVIAHEINNPLEAILNLLYLVSGRVEEDEVARNYIKMAESELQRISGITKQTLRWSKEGGQKAQYGTAGALFADVLRLFAGQIRNRQVTAIVEGGEEVQFHGTVGQVAQVVSNLVSNAVQAVPVGGRIWLRAEESGAMMEIVVRDEGHGMSKEALDNLFQPFYSTKGDLGNGLGLYISHEIVERHGGSLAVQSEPGKGTSVRVRLPTREPAVAAD